MLKIEVVAFGSMAVQEGLVACSWEIVQSSMTAADDEVISGLLQTM